MTGMSMDSGSSPPKEPKSSWFLVQVGWEYPHHTVTGEKQKSEGDVSAKSKRSACSPEHARRSMRPWGRTEEEEKKKKGIKATERAR